MCCVLPVNPDSLQLLSAEISWVLWCPCSKATDWVLFSAPTISVPWVEFGVCFFSFHTRHLFSLIGLVFLSWTPGFSSNNSLCAAVLLAEPETCKNKPPGCEAGSVLSIPPVRGGVRLGFLPWFPCRVMPLDAPMPRLGCVTVAVCSSPDVRGSLSQLWRRAGRAWQCHTGCSSSVPLPPCQPLLCHCSNKLSAAEQVLFLCLHWYRSIEISQAPSYK